MSPGALGRSDTISYNPPEIENIGKQIVLGAADAQARHDDYLNSTVILEYLATAPPATNGYDTIPRLISSHARRMGQRNGSSRGMGSYDWQVQMGNTLKFIAAGITEADNSWADSFKGKVPP